jgi:MauM/NapG family ferredoxin protein
VLPAQPAFWAQNIAVAVLFVAVLAANALRPRFWCRYLCPLGALLGLLARVSVLRQRVNPTACVRCGRCARVCPTGAITAERGYVADVSECTGCLDCAVTCPTQAISFRPGLGPVGAQRFDPSRRQALVSLGIAVVGAGLLKATRALAAPSRWLVRPPGASENSLAKKCIRCGQCVKVCPTGGLQPSLLTAGPDGLWTPVLVPRHGYCDYGCAACGQACPTQAIPRLELAQKRQMVLGRAEVDRTRCLVWAKGQTCIVCEEMCPVPDKAIRLDDLEVTDAQGQKILLRRPVVIRHKCIGCGSCEFHCPVEGRAAILVQRA